MRTDLRLLKKLLLANNAGLILERFEERRHRFHGRLRKARRKPSEKSVHNLRVAARRMLSMLALLETVVPPERTRKLRRTVKKRLRKLRRMRDIQVQILNTEKLLVSFPQLAGFHKSLIRKERRLSDSIGRQLRKFRLASFWKDSDRLMDRLLASMDPESDDRLGDMIGAAIEDSFREVLSLRARIDPQRPVSIHRMRLAFKKFRYMAEIAAPRFEHLTEERLRAMDDFQTRMGQIQDIESLLSTMRDYRRRTGRTSILVVENEVRHQRRRLVVEFLSTVDEVRFFWSTPPMGAREVV